MFGLSTVVRNIAAGVMAVLALVIAMPALAQGDKPEPKRDSDLISLVSMIGGSFFAEGEGEGGRPALWMHATEVPVDGLGSAMYFEIAREDAPFEPIRQGVINLYRRQGELQMRVFDFAGSAQAGGGLPATLTGLWTVPTVFPKLSISQLVPNMELAIKYDDRAGKATGATTRPYPTTRDGATEMTSTFALDAHALVFSDEGVDAAGKKVWGFTADEAPKFVRTHAKLKATKRDDGLVVITMVEPAAEATKHTEGGKVVVHYTGWLTDGTRFDSSRQAGREPLAISIPGGVVKGWNEGLKGIAKGERRRLLIPPDMAWGERGRGPVPPNATVVFDIECMHVDNSAPPVPPAGGH